jgi:hypothetical protein
MHQANTMERDELKGCKALLEAIGAKVIRINTGRRGGVSFGEKGVSDLWACMPHGGRTCVVEVKRRRGGRTTVDQWNFIAEIKRCGGLGFVVNSVDQLREELHKAGYL